MEQANQYLDGYVFIRSKKSWLALCRDWQADSYRYVARLEAAGPDADRIAVFCEALRSDDAAQLLKDRMAKAVSRANPTSSSGTAVLIGTNGPTRWSEKKTWGAYLRITTETGQARAVFDRLQPGSKDAPFGEGEYYGHALCDGDWNVLLELGADSPQALDSLVSRALAVRGVNSTATIVSKLKNDRIKPPKPSKCEDWVND
jgi:hypothetical protein